MLHAKVKISDRKKMGHNLTPSFSYGSCFKGA